MQQSDGFHVMRVNVRFRLLDGGVGGFEDFIVVVNRGLRKQRGEGFGGGGHSGWRFYLPSIRELRANRRGVDGAVGRLW
jgi:hypothetical protein